MSYIKLMRPKHYIKNVLIFIPLVFSGMFFNINNLLSTLVGLILFCLTSSIIYVINDINDKDKDKRHPLKKNRPIASGKVKVRNAIIFAITLFIITLILIFTFKIPLFSVSLLSMYFILNLGYSLKFKNVPLLDIVILVSGFLIRILYGASLLNINVSNWLYLSSIAISFYLALGKRRNELSKNGFKSRKVLKYYSKEFLDKNMYMFLSMAIVFYSLWTTDKKMVESQNNLLILTVPLVMVICMRYSMDIEGDSDGDPIEVIFKDKILLFLGFCIALVMFLILYVL